jgi:hypothetical protein
LQQWWWQGGRGGDDGGRSTTAVIWYARSFHTPIALCFLLLFEKVRRDLTTDLVFAVVAVVVVAGW